MSKFYHYKRVLGNRDETVLDYIKEGYRKATPTEFHYASYHITADKLVIPKEEFDR